MYQEKILNGRVAVITGGRRGIGKAIALAFAGAGADIAVCDLVMDDNQLEATAEEVRKMGRRALAIQADTSKKSDVENMTRKVTEVFGKVDILVNHAGINIKSLLLDMAEEDWDRVLDVDLKGYFLCAQAIGRIMAKQKRGVIINTASQFSFRITPERGAYCVAKSGVVMLTRVLAKELSVYGIRANAIAPGLTRTEFSRGSWSNPEIMKKAEKEIPLGRAGETGDIVGAALFLASDASSYITGSVINIDGGTLA